MPKWISALRFVGVGAYIGVSIFLGVYAGRALDARYHSGTLFTLVGLFVGLTVAVYGVYKMLKSIIKEWQDNGGKD